MAWWQSTLRRRASRIQDITEVRQASRVNGLTLMRVLVRIRMLDHASCGLRLQDDPQTVALFQIIGDLHACTGRPSALWTELDFGMGLIPSDGNAADIHLHGADIQRANCGQMLQDASADGVLVALLFLASANGAESGERQDCYGKSCHKHVHFPDLQSITHEEGDANVQNGKNSEGITKWAVDDVPKLEDALRSAEKGDALGQ